MIDIVDEDWAAATLPIEEIVIEPNELTNLEEDEHCPQEEDSDARWNDLSLEEFDSRASTHAVNSDPVAVRSPTVRNQCR